MEKRKLNNKTDRRRFLGKLTAGAATLGMASLLAPFQQLQAETQLPGKWDDPEEWFKKMTGKHRIIYDVVRPNGIMPFAWARVFLLTNQATGSPASDCNVVLVLRHDGIPYAFNNEIWSKYNFGEVFKIDDPASSKASTRNPLWKPGKSDFKIPGVGEVQIGINELQDSGVMFCVCDMAITVHSAVMGQSMKTDPAVIKKDWISGLLPGVQVMPSGVWAVGRAQEHGCAYCYTG